MRGPQPDRAGDHGSTLVLSNWTANGQSVANYRYGPYGESSDATTGNPFRYTGRYLDAETGFYYYRARYYSPTLGRFLQTDPIGSKDDLNLYAYVGGNPINASDPTGTEAATVTCQASPGGCGTSPSMAEMASTVGKGLAAVGDLAISAQGAGLPGAMAAEAGMAVKAVGEVMEASKAVETVTAAAKVTAATANADGATARAAGALVTRDGQMFTGLSNKGGAPFATNPTVDAAVSSAKTDLGGAAAPFGGHCCEMNVAAQALNAGADVRGATAAAVNVQSGAIMAPCNVCAAVMQQLQILGVQP